MTTPALAALVGQVLDGHYRLDRLLGAGGMGAVYKAHHTELHRDVAIKILHPDIGADPSISKRFDREAQSASRLDHPNCVRVTDFGTTDAGVKYLVMELLEGEELAAKLGKPWAPEAACAVLEQILAGLEHAHHHGIVHRDLKPENVFLTGGQQIAKIVDFGIAKLLDADGATEVLTRAGMVFGTPRYMSPEQAAGGKIDERSDLYSVGILAYVLLAGQLPFDSDDLAAVLRMQIMAPQPPLPASVPAPLATWVDWLLEKSRHERPASATVAREKLAQVRAQMADSAKPAQALAPASGPTQAQPSQPAAGLDLLGATGFHTAMSIEAPSLEPRGLEGPLPGKPEAMVGYRVADRFRLLSLLGAGGMGAVFRAEDTQTGTTVAVKILHAALAGDDEIASRFEREAKTASELEHPNIVPVFFHGTTPGIGGNARYLVMPLLEGVELRSLIGAPMDPARAGGLTLQLLDALAHAHAQAVVHRDLKPENVFVIRDAAGHEQVQLVDFGLAKVAEAGPSYRALTQFGQVFGTPAYMSPEQCRGDVVDARTDIYATGIILYELLGGRPPFDSDNPLVLLGMQLHQEPPPLPEQVPAALRSLVAGMLIKDREQRVPSAQIASEALRAALAAWHPAPLSSASMTSTMPPVTVSLPAQQPLAILSQLPRKWLYAGGGILALLLVVAILPTGSSSSEDDEDDVDDVSAASNQADTKPRAANPSPRLVNPLIRPDESVYLEIDRLLTSKQIDAALTNVRAARDEFPNDGGLMWREARALTLAGGETNRVTALHRFADAAAADPSLGDRTEFVAELRGLLRDPKLRETALDVAVRELGVLGHSFLLEVINDETSVVGYVDRHRVLDELQRDPAMLARADLRRQLMLDLRQASEAPAACGVFADALDRISKDGDAVYLEVLMDRSLDIPETPGAQDETNACAGLADKLEQVKQQLAAAHPEAAATAKKSGGSGKKKKGGGFRMPF
jgi:serine/threonine protein kinase